MNGDQRTDNYREKVRPEAKAEQVYDRVILLLLLALFLLLSPIIDWWAADDSPWYSPYLIWGLLIGLTFRLRRYIDRHTAGASRGD
jgi:hypothetical protein